MRHLRHYIALVSYESVRVCKHTVAYKLGTGLNVYNRTYHIYLDVFYTTSFEIGKLYLSFEFYYDRRTLYIRAYSIEYVPPGVRQLNCRKSYDFRDEF